MPSTATESRINQRDLRRCLGRFATGVTVVTCVDDAQRPCGITVNSFSSVSLDPPLVLWNIAKVSNSLRAFLDAEHFVINILAHSQRGLSAHFAKSDHTLFDNIEYTCSEFGAPIIPDTLARFECRAHQTYDCGDHYIVIGKIIYFEQMDREPLLFYDGDYAALDL